MTAPLHEDPTRAIALCREAHRRVLERASRVSEEVVRRPSQLPGWTVGHVLTHLARNADGHTVRLEGALRGEEIPRYPGGQAQRNGDIESGAGRPAAEIVEDLRKAQRRLEDTWERSAAAGWPHAELLAGDRRPTTASPVARLREVEVHHVDLGLGYEPAAWSDDYAAWELRELLDTLPERIRTQGEVRRMVWWLAGRGALPGDLALEPW